MTEIQTTAALLAADLKLISERITAWTAVNTRALSTEVADAIESQGVKRGAAETSADADVRAVRGIIRSLDETHAWLATLDNNLISDRLIS